MLVTVIVIVSCALSAGSPSSVTTKVTCVSLGLCASVGVQLKAPVLPSNVAPVGAPVMLYVSVCAGRSSSLADTVNVSAVSSAVDLLPIGLKTGAVLTSLTVTVKP